MCVIMRLLNQFVSFVPVISELLAVVYEVLFHSVRPAGDVTKWNGNLWSFSHF